MLIHDIFKRLGISYEKELTSRDYANHILKKVNTLDIRILENFLKNRVVNIIGPAEIRRRVKHGINIIADKALDNALELKIKPDIIVTDLDGDINKIINLSGRCIVIVHVHSDNIYKFSQYINKIKNLIVTTQIEPKGKIYNFGGFTDGDRAIHMAKYFKAKEINVYGFDFNNVITYSRGKEYKRKKLKIAKFLIEKFNNLNLY